MLRVALLALLLPVACARPDIAAPTGYTIPRPYSASTSSAYAPPSAAPELLGPWGDDFEKNYFIRHLAVVEGYRCGQIPRDEAARLFAALSADRAGALGVHETRREYLAMAAMNLGRQMATAGQPCIVDAIPAMRQIQSQYPVPRSRGAGPTPSSPPPGGARTGPNDSGWQSAPNAPRPAPLLKPDESNL